MGYRRNQQGGKWVLRTYRGKAHYKTVPLAQADDNVAADGKRVLDYAQAMRKARKEAGKSKDPAGDPLTVAGAMVSYFERLEGEGSNLYTMLPGGRVSTS